MRLIKLGICVVLVAVLLTCAAQAFAAGSPFSISGKVVDRYGNPVHGANVTLIDANFKTIKTLVTDEMGNYDFVNVKSDVGTCAVQFAYTAPDGTKYDLQAPYNRSTWYPTSGTRIVADRETTLTNYPPPVYGYVYGAIQTDTSNAGRFIDGIVYLESLDTGAKYYEFADRIDGKGSYVFYAPAGAYSLYAQHWENGVCYESARKQITIRPNAQIEEVIETRIVLPLYGPVTSPGPITPPSRHENTVNGTVGAEDGKSIVGATVTLYQTADNGSAFVPMRGADGKPQMTVTDAGGRYEFKGVSPATDDGKAIQAKKSIKALVEYHLTDNLTVSGWSGEKDLYYPDVILGYGKENEVRNVTLSPVVFSLEGGAQSQATASVSDVPPAPSNIAVIPLLAALAVGLVCLGGLYWTLNRKG